jgi:hypothetical protein
MPSSEPYCTPVEVRGQMKGESSADDTILTAMILAVSRFLDGYMGRAEDGFVALSTATARLYPGTGLRWLWIDECVSITSVKVKDAVTDTAYNTTLGAGEYRGFRGDPRTPNSVNFNRLPYHGLMLSAASRKSYFLEGSFQSINSYYNYNDRDRDISEVFEPTIEVTAKWGYAVTLPPIIKQAAIMQTTRIYKRMQGGMADALLSPDFGQSRFISDLDKDVKVLLNMSRLKRPQFGGGR